MYKNFLTSFSLLLSLLLSLIIFSGSDIKAQSTQYKQSDKQIDLNSSGFLKEYLDAINSKNSLKENSYESRVFRKAINNYQEKINQLGNQINTCNKNPDKSSMISKKLESFFNKNKDTSLKKCKDIKNLITLLSSHIRLKCTQEAEKELLFAEYQLMPTLKRWADTSLKKNTPTFKKAQEWLEAKLINGGSLLGKAHHIIFEEKIKDLQKNIGINFLPDLDKKSTLYSKNLKKTLSKYCK